MALAVALILLVLGSILFHFLSPWYFTPLASNWGLIDLTVDITFVVTGIVFVATNLFIAYCILRYRHRKIDPDLAIKNGHKAHYNPENTKLEWWLTIITSIGVIAMLAPGLVVWAEFVTVPDEASEFEAVGQQWHWSFRFPGEDGELGNVGIRHITKDNAFGMDPEDPAGQDDILIASPIVHLPVNQPVRVWLRSKDVLHDFAVPQFRTKMDLVPGHVTYTWFTPTVVGEYEILCEELCGLAHFAMRGRVIIDEQADFEAWLDEQPTYAALSQSEPDLGLGQASFALCAACHGQQGQGMQILNAPRIAGLDARYVERQLHYYRDGIRGTHELDTAGALMRPILVALPDDDAIKNVAAYIETMPPEPQPTTILGNIERGRDLYANCAVCHGAEGQGIWALNAPALAGQNDWYLVTQLKNFRDEIRGAHRMDLYGDQMMMMADILPDDQDIDDVVAYLNTLR
jgi:cytochrome c oxidase subunit 2